MYFIWHWLTSPWDMGIITLPGWAWALLIAVLATAGGLAMYALVATVRHDAQANNEMTTAFREAGKNESATTAAARQASADELYAARPAVGGPASSRGPEPAPEMGGGRGGATTPRFPIPDSWEERLASADDYAARAADPEAFAAWLERDRTQYKLAVDRIDRILASGIWSSTPWLAGRAAA